LESGVLENRDVLEELVRLRDGGLHIGLTLSGPNQAEVLRRAMDVTVAGRRLFDCVQATWNLLEPSAGPALQAAHEVGIGVIVKEALANGRLTGRYLDPTFAGQRRILEEVAAKMQTTLDAMSLAAVAAQPWADVVLSGAATVPHLNSNAAAFSLRWDNESAEKLRAIAETPQEYWSRRSRLAWN
jgi:aryl-alcohol dehydrogenase-like predicted oxidoreductase